MKTSSASPVSLELTRTAAGLTQVFAAKTGAVLLAGDAAGDLILALEGAPAAAVCYTSGSDGGARLERADLTVETAFTAAADAPGFDVDTRLTARAPLSVVAFGHAYAFPPGAAREPGAPLDYAWLPTLKSAPGDVAGDHVFRSPCLILRHSGAQAALVPNLALVGTGPLRAAMDLSVPRPGPTAGGASARGPAGAAPALAPFLSYALLDYKPHGHVYFAPTGRPAALSPGDTLRIGFTLLFDPEAGPLAFQPVLRFLWRRYGAKELAGTIAPQALPFEGYARLAFESTFERYGLWRGFRLGGRDAGGICARIMRPGLGQGSAGLPNDPTLRIAANYLLTRTMAPRQKAAMIRWNSRGIHPHLWNAVFFNNLRTSFGLMHYARRWNDSALAGRARAMWELALAAPQRSGIFPSVFAGDEGHPHWVPGTRIWKYTGAYHVPDAAVTGWWMLAVDRLLEGGGIFRERSTALGDFLLRAQLPSGAVPTWVSVGKNGALRPQAALAESAGSAAAGLFLACLADATGRGEYRDGARRVADFIIERVFPRQAWLDTEVFFSCSPKPLGWQDPTSGILPQGTLCMGWAAELMGVLYAGTRDERYLAYGRAALDLVLLFQQIWNAPFLSMDTRGGFGVMNTDAEWSDARQALFAPLILQWYGITGEPELFHRGVAALRAAFLLMYLEEHRPAASGNTRPMAELDRGAFAENYGHAGTDAKILGYVMPDWGGGTAVSAAALAELTWGDLYVDAARGAAFGVNGCRVLRSDIRPDSISLEVERLPGSSLLLKCPQAAAPRVELTVDGQKRGAFDPPALARGVRV